MLSVAAADTYTLLSAAADTDTLTAGRLVGTVGALVALAGVAIRGLALARAAGRLGNGNRKRGSIVAIAAVVTGIVSGGLVLAAAEGGHGTGYGVVGAAAALVFGLIAAALGGLALARSRKPADRSR